RYHAAVALLAAQPTEKGAHQEFAIEAIGLCTPMFARHRDAGGMNDISFDIARPQPARQPEAETLNALLDTEADRLCNARRYERSDARRDTRAGHYERNLQTRRERLRQIGAYQVAALCN